MHSLRTAAAAPSRAGASPASISPRAAAFAAAPLRRRLCRSSSSSSATAAAAATQNSSPTVSLRLGSAADAATISLPLPQTAARRLDAELRALHATLRAKQEAAEAGERPKRWAVMEFAFPTGEDDDLSGQLEYQLYCNPNAHGSAFDAKVLVRVECGGGGAGMASGGGGGGAAAASAAVRMTGEARLTDVQGTLEVYWEGLGGAQGGKK